MAFRVFISYSTRDLTLVDQLQYWLELNGIEVYLAELYPALGQPLSSKIEAAIRDSDCVLAILTDDGLRSEWVHHELGIAKGSGKLVIPLLEPRLQSPAYLKGLEYIPFDPSNPLEAIDGVVRYLSEQKTAKEAAEQTRATVLATAILTIGLFSLAAASRRKE